MEKADALEGAASFVERAKKQVDAGYALTYALMHDPAFDDLRKNNKLTSQTLRALAKAKRAYGAVKN